MKIGANRALASLIAAAIAVAGLSSAPVFAADSKPAATAPLFNDSHFHLTNYVQKGITVERYLEIMGDVVGRSTLFGIPLQQTWSYENSGNYAPTYYLQSDAPLYYYSFTDAAIAMAYKKLKPEQQARLDPMITGFNPADMYGVDHIRRVLEIFPGVFSGIGEFTIHKEFVSPKVAGEVASLTNPALDKILDFAGEVGLVVIIHSDIDVPFAKANTEPVYLTQMKDLLRRHPKTTIIWAHTGLGRVVHPTVVQDTPNSTVRSPRHGELIAAMLADPTLAHVYFDISWDEVAKYAISSPETEKQVAAMLNKYPDRFLFGTDNVAPPDQAEQLRVFHLWDPVFAQLTPAASQAVRIANYNRLFDAARKNVRAWEAVNVK
jgi:hypothetical protein